MSEEINQMNVFGETMEAEKKDTALVVDTAGQKQNKEVKDASFKLVCEKIDGVIPSLYNYAQDYIIYQSEYKGAQTVLTSTDYIEGVIELFNLDIRSDEKFPFRNDVSFFAENKTIIYLFEAQTKYADDMAFRCMDYYCRLVNKREVVMLNAYKEENGTSKGFKWRIPRPEFYVFYFQDTKKKITSLEDHFDGDKTPSEFLGCRVHNIQLSLEMFEKLEQGNKELKAYCKFNKLYEQNRVLVTKECEGKNFSTKDDRNVYIANETTKRTYETIEQDPDIKGTQFIKEALLEGFLDASREECRMNTLDREIELVTAMVTKEVTKEAVIKAYTKGITVDLIAEIQSITKEKVISILEEEGLM